MKPDKKPVVVCVHCNTKLYHCGTLERGWSGAVVNADDLTPVSNDIPQPKNGDTIECPKCGELYAAPIIDKRGVGIVLKLDDGSWWPHPPIEPHAKSLTH